MVARLLRRLATAVWRQTVGRFVAAAYAAYSRDRRGVGGVSAD